MISTNFRLYFGDYPREDIPEVFLSAPWVDTSYRNDACPSFERDLGASEGEAVIRLFIDYVDPAKRELTDGGHRFAGWTSDANGDCDNVIETDDLAEVLAWVEEQAAKDWPRAPLTDAERAHFEGGRLA